MLFLLVSFYLVCVLVDQVGIIRIEGSRNVACFPANLILFHYLQLLWLTVTFVWDGLLYSEWSICCLLLNSHHSSEYVFIAEAYISKNMFINSIRCSTHLLPLNCLQCKNKHRLAEYTFYDDANGMEQKQQHFSNELVRMSNAERCWYLQNYEKVNFSEMIMHNKMNWGAISTQIFGPHKCKKK